MFKKILAKFELTFMDHSRLTTLNECFYLPFMTVECLSVEFNQAGFVRLSRQIWSYRVWYNPHEAMYGLQKKILTSLLNYP